MPAGVFQLVTSGAQTAQSVAPPTSSAIVGSVIAGESLIPVVGPIASAFTAIGASIAGLFGKGRKQADIVTGAYDGGVRQFIDSIVYEHITNGLTVAQLQALRSQLSQLQALWFQNVLSKVTDPRVLPTAQFIYNGHEVNPVYANLSFPFAFDVLDRLITQRSGNVVPKPAAPVAVLPAKPVQVVCDDCQQAASGGSVVNPTGPVVSVPGLLSSLFPPSVGGIGSGLLPVDAGMNLPDAGTVARVTTTESVLSPFWILVAIILGVMVLSKGKKG